MEFSNQLEFTQKQLFGVFAEADQSTSKFGGLTEKDYHSFLLSKLPVENRCDAIINMNELKHCLRSYRKKKGNRGSLRLEEVAATGNNDISLTVTSEVGFQIREGSSTANLVVPEEKPTGEPPTKTKKTRGPKEFRTSFTRSYKDFNNMSDQQKRNITEPLISMITTFIDTNQFDLTVNQLLGYLFIRENSRSNNACAKIGKEILLENEEQVTTFTAMEAVSLMHSLVLSKEQTRKVRDFLATKNVEFPTTNQLLPVRKGLRPDTFSVLDGKGRSLSYVDLINHTISSVFKIVRETSVIQEKRNLRMYLKDGGDGAGTMPVLKSKHCVDDVDHIFQYGIIPLKLTAASDTTEEEILWSNAVPNSARSLRPVYLIREIETDENLLKWFRWGSLHIV